MSKFVLVHGLCHGGWCWEPTATDLAALGHDVTAVDLPLTGLDDDASVVTHTLDRLDGPVVLVGHSYGGLVISRVANGRDDVSHLVYIAALMIGADDVSGAMVDSINSTNTSPWSGDDPPPKASPLRTTTAPGPPVN